LYLAKKSSKSMSRNSNAYIRYQEINDLFNARRGKQAIVTTEEILETLNISMRQWRTDKQMLEEMGAVFEYDARLRGWRYAEPFNFSDPIPLSIEDLYNLRLAVATLAQLNQIADFKNLPQTVEKIGKAVGRWVDRETKHKAIYFDQLPRYEGSRHLPFFMHAIEKEQQVRFQYQSFRAKEPSTYLFDPYFLRQHHQRWYLGGWSHAADEGFIRTFPLERMVGEPILSGQRIDYRVKPHDFDPVKYWQHVIGINRPANGKVEAVVLEFNAEQGKYFESQPFFQPYEVLERSDEKLVISLQLMIEIELIRKLAAYGAEVKVLAPDELKTSMQRFYAGAVAAYTL
jgi:predicted DNA-binding transcriptional regulator YafY